MTDFNALPLAEKKKQAQAGDIAVTDSGARVPIQDVDKAAIRVEVCLQKAIWISATTITDIIGPTARKVPEVVLELKYIQHHSDVDPPLSDVIQALTDHFEKETP